MAQIINTNVLSLNAQRNLSTSQGALATSLERLSSGLRINSAKDDAAGLAISERFTTQIRGQNQAIRNANDGISLAQTAEGAMQEIGNNLQRIRELAVQSRNATNSADDRAALDAEVQLRIQEVQRVAQQTEFNGAKLLDGNFTAQVFQVGANVGQTISVDSIASMQTAELGEWKVGGGFEASYDTSAATLTTAGTGAEQRWGYEAVTFTINVDGEETAISVPGSTVPVADGAGFESEDAAREALATAIEAAVNEEFADAASADGTALTINLAEDFLITDPSANVSGIAGAATEAAEEEVTGFANENVLTAEAADRMMLAMDAALTAVNTARADLGALQNRFESTIANLSTSVENLSASRSRIRDADFAAETAELTRAQILQQAGISVLSQANAQPQSVLALLQ